jgi:FlaA1/EpsC-like NDP-sugar epimerase
MRRYFMTIPEAVQLLLQASVLGQGGEVFLLDMGELVKIVDLARDMIELSGLEVGTDIEIVFTGMRSGEKLFEELFVKGESHNRTRHEKIYIAGNANSFVPHDLEGCVEALEVAARRNDREAILRVLHGLVPEYQQSSQSSGTVAGASGGPAPVRPVDAALPVDSKAAPAQRRAVSA